MDIYIRRYIRLIFVHWSMMANVAVANASLMSSSYLASSSLAVATFRLLLSTLCVTRPVSVTQDLMLGHTGELIS